MAVGEFVRVAVIPGKGVLVKVGGTEVCVFVGGILVAVARIGVETLVDVGVLVNVAVTVGKGVLERVGATKVGVIVGGMGVEVGGLVVAVGVEGTGVAPLSVNVLVNRADPLCP